MRYFLILFFSLISCFQCFGAKNADSLLKELKIELSKKSIYDNKKELRIKALKLSIENIPNGKLQQLYDVYNQLYEEYKVYQFDSAYTYNKKIEHISQILHDKPKFYDSKIKEAFILLSAGMFKESFECLNEIDSRVLSDSIKVEYYSLKSRSYSDLADYNNNVSFTPYDNALSIKYIDSALRLCKPNSYQFLMLNGNKQIILQSLDHPSVYLNKLLSNFPITEHQRAMAATGLSFFYFKPENRNEKLYWLETGVINDIRSSTKETLAAFKLGEELYKEGLVNDAYILVEHALDDAQYYGARLRKLKIAAVLPVIAAAKNINTENEKNRLQIYLLSSTAITLLIIAISFIVFVQLKRLKVKEGIIEQKNLELSRINNQLSEDAHIKEEYIGYFFNNISGYISKLEKLKRNIERKIATKKYDDILITINDINIKKERENLFYTFDHVFLKIFPNFIIEFNSLLKKEDQIWPKDNEVLNTDLRIFALMRLGIDENQTIANILEYSVSTIYVYKMRIKAKALVQGELFDQKIMSIKSIDISNKPV